jgi:hypothetical protein
MATDTTPTDELRAQLEDGLASLIKDREHIDGQIASVRKAIKALDPAQFAKESHRASPKAMAKLSDAPEVAPEVIPAGKLLRLLNGNSGLSTRELAKQTNGDSAQLLELLKELEADGKVHRTGERAGTRWHAPSELPAGSA